MNAADELLAAVRTFMAAADIRSDDLVADVLEDPDNAHGADLPLGAYWSDLTGTPTVGDLARIQRALDRLDARPHPPPDDRVEATCDPRDGVRHALDPTRCPGDCYRCPGCPRCSPALS